LVAVTVSPVLAVSPSALSDGYALQSQLVPRGTESPSATIDHVRGALGVLVEECAVVDEVRVARVTLPVPPHPPPARSRKITTTKPPGRISPPRPTVLREHQTSFEDAEPT